LSTIFNSSTVYFCDEDLKVSSLLHFLNTATVVLCRKEMKMKVKTLAESTHHHKIYIINKQAQTRINLFLSKRSTHKIGIKSIDALFFSLAQQQQQGLPLVSQPCTKHD
jgi:hypothetical protein